MKNLRFHTNLDIEKRYIPFNLGERFSFIPRIGERVQLRVRKDCVVELEVVSIWHEVALDGSGREGGEVVTFVELHIPSWFRGSIKEWEERQKNRGLRE